MAFEEPILHVDMDAFFVEVERLRNSALRDRPVVVGGSGARSVVAAASYEARQFGVRSAMPSVEARRRCPDLVFVPPDHDEYGRVSAEVFNVLRTFSPLVEGISVDEAFIDVGGLRLHYPSSVAVASLIRDRIRHELALPCSVGIASTKFVAKLASVRAKPDGLFHVTKGETITFLHGLAIIELWGVGRATAAALRGLGVETVAELASVPSSSLERAVGDSMARHLQRLAVGIDDRKVVPDAETKSVSVEVTVDHDLTTLPDVLAVLRNQSYEVTRRLRRGGHRARTVSVKLRAADFTTITRSETMSTPVDMDREVFEVAVKLTEMAFSPTRPLRLIGVGLSQLSPATQPTQLAVDVDPRWSAVTRAADEVRDRFGVGSLFPGSGRRDREKTWQRPKSSDI